MKKTKRSKSVRLLLIGGISVGALTGCNRNDPSAITTENVYTNNYHLAGVGYYHAPFSAWYDFPYNHYDSQKKQYYYGGRWGNAPYESIMNVSAPTAQAAADAQSARWDISRGGFGRTSGGHYWISS